MMVLIEAELLLQKRTIIANQMVLLNAGLVETVALVVVADGHML